LLGALAAACSPASVFNQVALLRARPRVTRGVAYGPGPRGRLDIYRPRGEAPGGHPVVVFYYGGSWNSGERGLYSFLGAAMAEQGYVTVVPDYRLYPEVRFPDFLKDNAEALQWVARNAAAHGGDPGRLALMGHSAGAYNAMMLGLDREWLAKAQLDPSLVKAVVGLAGPYDFYPYKVAATQETFGAWPDPAQTQPITFVRKDAPAVFVANGLADVTVGPHNARNLAARLRSAGATAVEERYYPKVNHTDILTALSFPFRDKAPVLTDVVGFLKRSGVA
jgi:acetyl esterase/lipase